MSDAETKTETRDIHVPDNALTNCPIRQYGLVGIARVCLVCTQFRGLYDVLPGPAPFAAKYRVQCGVPQAREIVMVEMGSSALPEPGAMQ